MIDPRFPPQPQRTDIPLYAFRHSLEIKAIANFLLSDADPQAMLLAAIKDYLPNETGRFYFRDTAGSCLADYISFKKNILGRAVIVALPAFCCPNFCMKIVAAGAKIVLLDIDKNYDLSKESVSFASNHGANMLLWPSYFGVRERQKSTVFHANDLGMEIIFDEAQSFPGSLLSSEHPSLLSFGSSKRVQGTGGGALYFPEGVRIDGFDMFKSKNNRNLSACNIIKDHLTNCARQHITASLPSSMKRRFLGYQKELPSLLEKTIGLYGAKISSEISDFDLFVCVDRLKNLESSLQNICKIFYDLRCFIRSHVGESALDIISGILGLPSIFAIRVDKNRRYEFCADLARQGIQTTWYYYPLNMIPVFSDYPCEEIHNTRKISAEIVILPFGLGVVSKGSERYLNALRGMQ